MINSKEQYERIMQNAEFQGKMPVEHVGLLAETIEALREVAKAAKEYVGMGEPGDKFPLPELQAEIDAYLKAKEAVADLPDWITDG